MDIREYDPMITQIYHNSETEKPVITITNNKNVVVYDANNMVLFIMAFQGGDNTKNAFIANNAGDHNLLTFNEYMYRFGMDVLVTHEIDKYQSAHIYIYDSIYEICFAELVYHERTNTVNIYNYKDNNPTELISSIILLD